MTTKFPSPKLGLSLKCGMNYEENRRCYKFPSPKLGLSLKSKVIFVKVSISRFPSPNLGLSLKVFCVW